MTTKTFNVLAPEVQDNPYPLFAAMRREAPVCQVLPFGYWAVSRYQDVVYVLRHPERFSSSGYNTVSGKTAARKDDFAPSIVTVDPPAHTRLRGLVTKAFTPRVVSQLEPRIRQLTNELLDKFVPQGRVELIEEFTIPLPMIVIAEMLGVGPERRRDFKRWSDDMMSTVALNGKPDPARVAKSTEELSVYLGSEIEARRRAPKDDLLSHLVHSEAEGSKLTASEVLSFANTLLIAGNETTTSLIGNAMVALLQNPAELEKVKRDPALVPNLVEETLRYLSPAQNVFREAKEDVELGGVTIPKGAVVLPLLASANRDEAKFPDPDRFDITRDTKGHLAFGLDLHFCVGAPLARTEGRVALEAILSRLDDLAFVEPKVQWADSFFMRCPQRLPLSFRAA